MKILFLGDSMSEQYVRAFYNECNKRDGIEASLFDYGRLKKKSFLSRIELHYKNGFLVFCLNQRLILECEREHYDLVFVYYSTILYGSTIRRIRKTGCKVFMYCNDNPFSDKYKPYIWRHFWQQIPYYDKVYAYRDSNIYDYKVAGAKNVGLMMPYYISDRNYYIQDSKIAIDVPDVVFLGHMENDDRIDYIKSLLDAGIEVGVNSDWKSLENYSDRLVFFSREEAVQHYNEIINKAKIAIVFLSILNKDTYTRRCFEIPATETLMIAPYTEDLISLFEPGKEAVFYKDKEDFLTNVLFYLNHEDERKEIGRNGYLKLMNGRNEVGDRIQDILNDYDDITFSYHMDRMNY